MAVAAAAVLGAFIVLVAVPFSHRVADVPVG